MRRQAGKVIALLFLAAVDRVNVHSGGFSALWNHGHIGAAGRHYWEQLILKFVDYSAHMAHGAIA